MRGQWVLPLLALVCGPAAIDAFAPSSVQLRHGAVPRRSPARGARLPSLRGAQGKSARLSMSGDADSVAASAAVQAQPVPKRTKVRIETGYSNAPFLGDAIQQALRQAAGKLPEGIVPHAVLFFINSLYCNDGLVGETVTRKDGRYLFCHSPVRVLLWMVVVHFPAAE